MKRYRLEDLEYKGDKTWAKENYDKKNIITRSVLGSSNWTSNGGKPIMRKMSLTGGGGVSTKVYQGGE